MKRKTKFSGILFIVYLFPHVVWSQQSNQSEIEDATLEVMACVDVLAGEYSIKQFSRFAESLILIDSAERLNKLKEFCALCDSKQNPINGVIVCQMLFEPQPPLLGVPTWIGEPGDRIRILEPIVFVNTTPILGVYCYKLPGPPQTSSLFFQKCMTTRVCVKEYKSPDVKQIKADLEWYLDFIKLPLSGDQDTYSKHKYFLLQQATSTEENK